MSLFVKKTGIILISAVPIRATYYNTNCIKFFSNKTHFIVIYDTNYFTGDWILLKRNVCFGARANQYGTFNIQYDAYMTGIKLVHVGGIGVTCLENVALTKWGCDYINQFSNRYVSVVITNYQNNKLYPYGGHIGSGFYSVPGYNANSPYLIFGARNYTVYRNEEFRIHYAETLMGYYQNNNGTSCADIYAKLCDA